MIDREQVLHVARLARLELSEEELERMAGELSGVLDHIEKIGELGDLVDVAPTSHVVAVQTPAYLGLAALALLVGGAWRAIADERTGAPESAYTPPPPRPAPPERI